MAAYDLDVHNSAQVRVPQNTGIQGVMQFARMQQQNKNARDSLSLQKRKADDFQENLLANRKIAQDKLAWDQGADQRELDGRVALNQAFAGAYDKGIGGLADGFNFTDGNIEAIQNNANFQAMSPEKQQAFMGSALNKFKGNIGQHVGIKKVEEALRAQYSNTGGTPEQIENKIQSRLSTMFPEQPQMGAGMLKAMMGGGRGGVNGNYPKAKSLDDSAHAIKNANYAQDWNERSGVESGNGTAIWDPTSWIDFGDPDLTEQNMAQFGTFMQGYGFNDVHLRKGLDAIRDGDTTSSKLSEISRVPARLAAIDRNLSKEEYAAKEAAIMNSSVGVDFQKVMNGAQNSRGLTSQSQDPRGGNNNSAAVMQMLNRMNQPRGQASTELQRREILMGMLNTKIQQAQVSGNSGKEVTKDVAEIKTEIDKIDEKVAAAETTNSPEANLSQIMSTAQKNTDNGFATKKTEVQEQASEVISSAKNQLSDLMTPVKNAGSAFMDVITGRSLSNRFEQLQKQNTPEATQKRADEYAQSKEHTQDLSKISGAAKQLEDGKSITEHDWDFLAEMYGKDPALILAANVSDDLMAKIKEYKAYKGN